MRIYQGGYQKGRWKVQCERCGFDYRSHQLRLEWTGLRVCDGPGTNRCYEERHPLDFVRGVRDEQAPEWVAPALPDRFVFVNIQDASGNDVLDAVADEVSEAGGNETYPDDL